MIKHTNHFSTDEKKPSKRLKKPQRKVKGPKTVSRKVHYVVGGGCSFHIASDETSKQENDPGISLTTAKSW